MPWFAERWNDMLAMLKAMLKGHQATMWTCLPGLIVDFDETDMTATIQPISQATIRKPDNSLANTALPLIPKCPVQFPGGGGTGSQLILTHPVGKDDEVLVIFASRCIDSWWQQGGNPPPLFLRMHHLSDAFCIPMVWSKPNALTNFSNTSMQVRTPETVLLDISPTLATFSINVLIKGTSTATVDHISNGKSGHNHEHDYMPGDGAPIPTSPPI